MNGYIGLTLHKTVCGGDKGEIAENVCTQLDGIVTTIGWTDLSLCEFCSPEILCNCYIQIQAKAGSTRRQFFGWVSHLQTYLILLICYGVSSPPLLQNQLL